ncbi:DNA mismatch repair protein MutS [Escherichia coli]|nr:MAG: DNA mismatch repair protein MutS [Azospira oryzae]RDT50942.1 DNA mismatch repair protein MutS [Escherichia coli]HCI5391121.1 DNA mismatch repair protein MutS [Klebsiella pneumoniae]
MNFLSIVYASQEITEVHKKNEQSPHFFVDLNLDRVINAILHGREEYNLKEIFFSPLKYISDIYYRQGVIQDIAEQTLYQSLISFSSAMKKIQEISHKKEYQYYHYQKRRWDLESILLYCDAVTELENSLQSISLTSCGMTNFRTFLSGYVGGEEFIVLYQTAKEIKTKIEGIQYSMRIKGDSVTIKSYHSEINYSDEILSVFGKFRQHSSTEEKDIHSQELRMNNLEARILDAVASLFQNIFSELDDFISKNVAFQNETLKRFDREVQFYLACIEYFRMLRLHGIAACIPELTQDRKAIFASDACDISLAESLRNTQEKIVFNDFYLQKQERIMVISGPNQGGKTTFARMVGQLHYLALLGIYVPAREARLFLVDDIYTHFENSENIHNLRGKLYDDLVRMKNILDVATSRSLIIMNEIFTSTTTRDAIYLGSMVTQKVIALDALCVLVTFIDELTKISPSIVSMLSCVEHGNEAVRTYKIIRKKADGVAWSQTLVDKYHLNRDDIKARIKS